MELSTPYSLHILQGYNLGREQSVWCTFLEINTLTPPNDSKKFLVATLNLILILTQIPILIILEEKNLTCNGFFSGDWELGSAGVLSSNFKNLKLLSVNCETDNKNTI